MTDNLIDRRTINAGAVWAVPTVLAAVAAPAAAGSQDPTDPPPVCIPGVSYRWEGIDSWNGNNLPQGITIVNNTGRTITVEGEVTNTPNFVDVGNPDATVVLAHNGGTFAISVPTGTSVTLRIGVEKASNNSTGFMRLTTACDGLGRFQMKSVNKIDRLDNIEGNGK